MTQKEKDKIREAMTAISKGDKRAGLSIMADLVRPSWRQEAIAEIVSDDGSKSAKQMKKKPRQRKTTVIPKEKVEGALAGAGTV